jgi:hypothetical protein
MAEIVGLPGHCLVLVPFPGFHVVRSNPEDRVNCLVDREEYLDCTWILCMSLWF